MEVDTDLPVVEVGALLLRCGDDANGDHPRRKLHEPADEAAREGDCGVGDPAKIAEAGLMERRTTSSTWTLLTRPFASRMTKT